MRKEFNKVKPYCYIVKRLTDGKKYFGVRWSNITTNRTPLEDLGKKYFTSRPSLREEFKNNRSNFKIKFVATFQSIGEARDYELNFNKKILKNKNWLNTSAFPQVIHNEVSKEKLRKFRIGKKLSQSTKKKIAKSNKGKKHSLATIERMKKAQIGSKHWAYGLKGKENPNFGKKHSEFTKKKLKISIKKAMQNEEIRKKISIAATGRISTFKGKRHSNESKKKMSLAHKGKPSPMKGKKHSKEFREKLRKAWIARRKRGVSLETRKKLSEAFSGKNHPLYGKRGKNSVNWGKKWSHSTKQKMSASAKLSWTDSRRKSAKGRKAWNKGKKHSQATKLKIGASLKKKRYAKKYN